MNVNSPWVGAFVGCVTFLASLGCPRTAAAAETLFSRTNLMAWCIVPFDAKKRGPEERAAMMERLGFKHFAYDYRAEHIPTFDAEIEACQRHGVSFDAWWFPNELNAEAKLILEVVRRHKLKLQLWVSGGGGPTQSPAEQRARVEAEATRIRPIAGAARKLGCTVGLYNHGGWFGEPENQLEILERLRRDGITNVGLVYNLHHGHDHLLRFVPLLKKIKPHLLVLNLNGMTLNGDKLGKKILPLAQGDADFGLLKAIRDSGWRGPIGILNHTDEDAEARLRDNLDGLDWLVARLEGKPPGPRPKPRSWKEPAAVAQLPAPGPHGSLSPAFGRALTGGMVVPGQPAYRSLPITVECRAKLNGQSAFNILVASDPKVSSEHWELYAYAGTGFFSALLPGRAADVRSAVDICDGRWHHLVAILEPDRVRLFVDGTLAKDTRVKPIRGEAVPGALGLGCLAEGGPGCQGLIDDVRISRGVRMVSGVPAGPAQQDGTTVGLWNFDDLKEPAFPALDPWALEDPKARAALPEFKEIPAAKPGETTAAVGWPPPASMTNWHRSLGDSTSSRFSALSQINRDTVKRLEVAWTYHSKDGEASLQCNPIIIGGVMYAPTAGHRIAAVNAETGEELWRFKPEIPPKAMRVEDAPARRGMVYWPGDRQSAARILFTAGNWIYALDPKGGQLIESFGQHGRTFLPAGGTAAGAVHKDVLVIPGFSRDVFGYNVRDGRLLWTFHTVPQPGEAGYDTWSRTGDGVNCWGGMALDEQRGIAYVSTGSPKPSFAGVTRHGENLFANCVIALDAQTGRRLWHFQEVRHDLWDLDLPAPPNLVTVTHEGRRVDAVAQVTKLGNTLLLDRVSGQPLFPFRLRRAPVSTLPGEWTSPYQPDPELPEPFARRTFGSNDLTNIKPQAQEFVGKRLAGANAGFFAPFQDGRATAYFGVHGGAEWPGAAFDPASGFLYVSANEIPSIITVFQDEPEPPRDPTNPSRGEMVYQSLCASCHGPDRVGEGGGPPLRGLRNRITEPQLRELFMTGRNIMPALPPMSDMDLNALLDFLLVRNYPWPAADRKTSRPTYRSNGSPALLDLESYPGSKPPWGTLNCIDLNTGKLRWKVPLGEYPELTALGVPKTGTENFGGAMVTAGGLVFCSGTRDKKIRAFDQDTGAELWSHELPLHGTAPPATYLLNGRQYVVIAATGGGPLGGKAGDAWVAFALPRTGPAGK